MRSFGSSKDESRLRIFETKARHWMDEQTGPKLPFRWDRDDEIEGFMSGLSNSQVKVCGPELVFGSLYDSIGYGAIGDMMLRHLVICRLFNPGSKLKTMDYLWRYLHIGVSKQMYTVLSTVSARWRAVA